MRRKESVNSHPVIVLGREVDYLHGTYYYCIRVAGVGEGQNLLQMHIMFVVYRSEDCRVCERLVHNSTEM